MAYRYGVDVEVIFPTNFNFTAGELSVGSFFTSPPQVCVALFANSCVLNASVPIDTASESNTTYYRLWHTLNAPSEMDCTVAGIVIIFKEHLLANTLAPIL